MLALGATLVPISQPIISARLSSSRTGLLIGQTLAPCVGSLPAGVPSIRESAATDLGLTSPMSSGFVASRLPSALYPQVLSFVGVASRAASGDIESRPVGLAIGESTNGESLTPMSSGFLWAMSSRSSSWAWEVCTEDKLSRLVPSALS